MNTKLTLSLDSDVIKAAKDYAKKSGRSLSQVIEGYLKKITYHPSDSNLSIGEDLQELYGCIKLPKEQNDKEAIRSILIKKHLK